MKTITAILIYTAITHMPFDVFLGITAGLLFGALCMMVFVGPTPQDAGKISEKSNLSAEKSRKNPTRRIINSTAKQHAYVFVPTNYEWSAA